MKRVMVDEPVMDLNQAVELVSDPIPTPQIVHNLMSMPLLELPYYPTTSEDDDEVSFMHILRQNLELFWHQQMMEIVSFSDFRSQQHLPLARVKRIMKSDPEVKMISADTPVLFAKACEIFILELTLRAWLQTEACRRRTLQRCAIARVLRREEVYDFLIDIVPFDHHCDFHKAQAAEEENVSQKQMVPPALDMNVPSDANQIPPNQEVPLQLMIKPYMTPAEFHFNPGFNKVN